MGAKVVPAAKTARKKVGGRQKGTPNKVSASVKESIMCVYEDLGGRQGLAAWAKSHPNNKAKLYEWWARMAPKEIVADVKADGEFKLSWDK